jgi:hypothetical protein
LVTSNLSLQPDYSQLTFDAVNQLIAIERAIALGQAISNSTDTSSSTNFVANTIDVWTNGIWFLSLALSLIAALLAVLVKQWLLHYNQFITGSPLQRATLRHYRFMGLKKWQVPAIIGILPYFLHLALLLFFAGMCLYIKSLYGGKLFAMMLTVAAGTYAVFALTHLLDYFFPSCPYKSVVVSYVQLATGTLNLLSLKAIGALYILSLKVVRCLVRILYTYREFGHRRRIRWEKGAFLTFPTPVIYGRKEREATALASHNDHVLADSLIWLHTEASNPSVQAIIGAATAGLPWDFDQREVENLWRHGLDDGKLFSNILNEWDRICDARLTMQTSLLSAQVRALWRLYPFSRNLLTEVIDESTSSLGFASLSEIIKSPSSSYVETIAVAYICLSRYQNSGYDQKIDSLLYDIYVQVLKAIDGRESSSAWCLLFHALGCIHASRDRYRELAIASYFLRDFSISHTILRRSRDLKSPKISQPRKVHCTFQEARDSKEFTFHDAILNNTIWCAPFIFGSHQGSLLPPIPYGNSIHTVMPAVVSLMRSNSREILPESPWHFIFTLKYHPPPMMDDIEMEDVDTVWARVFCFVLFEYGTFNQVWEDYSPLNIEDYVAVGHLSSFWLRTHVSKESTLDQANVDLIIRHCCKMISKWDDLSGPFMNRYSINIGRILSHLVDHSTMWNSAMGQDIFLLGKWLIRKWNLMSFNDRFKMDIGRAMCALHFHNFSFAAEEYSPLQEDFHTFVRVCKKIGIATEVFLPLVNVFNGPFLQKQMSQAQRLLSANYLFELMVGLLGLQEAIDSEAKIYIYKGDEK